MTKQQIYKMVVTALRLRLRTIRDHVAHGIFRLALRFPQKCKIFGGPLLAAIVTCVAVGMTSCKAWRTISTTATYTQASDTSKVTTTITTKTVEEYQGVKQ